MNMEAEYNECCNRIEEKEIKADWECIRETAKCAEMNGCRALVELDNRLSRIENGERCQDSALQEENKRLNKDLAEVKRLYNENIERKWAITSYKVLREQVKELTKQNDRLLTAREANVNEIGKLKEEKQKLCVDLDCTIKHVDNLLREKYYSGFNSKIPFRL